MAFNIDDPLGSLGISGAGLQAQVYDIAYYVIWGLVIVGVLIFAWMTYQNKKIYIYKVRIFRRRENGIVKEINKNGGYLVKNGQTIFAIKMSKFKKKELGRLPDSSLMDEEDRIYFYQLSPDAPLMQCKRTFTIDKVEVLNEKYVEPSAQQKETLVQRYYAELKLDEENKDKKDDELKLMAVQRLEAEIEDEKTSLTDITNVYYTPVPTDQKLQAYLDIKKFQSTLGVDVNKQFAYFVIGIVALVIAGAVIFYIAVNKGDIPLLTK
jgi:hypothetical protein